MSTPENSQQQQPGSDANTPPVKRQRVSQACSEFRPVKSNQAGLAAFLYIR